MFIESTSNHPTRTPIVTTLRTWGQTCVAWLQQRLPRKHVPVIFQLNAIECGAACLAMVLSYYGRNTRVSECRNVMGIGRDGVSARQIVETARTFGLTPTAMGIQDLSAFAEIPLPAILHWEGKHFVVLERWSANVAYIVDPGMGRMKLSHAEFGKLFSGVAISFAPADTFKAKAPEHHWGLWRKSIQQTMSARGFWLRVMGLSVLLQVLGMIMPWFNQVLIDEVLPAKDMSWLSTLAIGAGGLVLSLAVLGYVRARILVHLYAKIDREMMSGFFAHLLSLPFQFFQQRNSGDLLMRLGSNSTIRDTLTSELFTTVLDALLAISYFFVLLYTAPWMLWLVGAFVLLETAMLVISDAKMRYLMQRSIVTESEMRSYLIESLSGIATIKTSGIEDRVMARWQTLFERQMLAYVRSSHARIGVSSVLDLMHTAAPTLLLMVGTAQVMQGELTLGTMTALNTIAMSLLGPLSSIIAKVRDFRMLTVHVERLADVMLEPPEQANSAAKKTFRVRGAIMVRDVSYRYSPHAPWALRNISIYIRPGQKIGIVGGTGSGKSTLAKLLLGLHTPTEGNLYFDAFLLQNTNHQMLRAQCGVVLQDPFLFSGSIRDNITVSNDKIPLKRVMWAAQMAGIHDEIMQLPMQYETRVAEGGSGFSGGQIQRLVLARALVNRPAVLLLDEATSHLDSMTEAVVEENLNRLSCTRIVIAHRLSTIKNADQILVMDAGQIIEQGTHVELMTLGQRYAQMVQMQS
ncbi:MAG: peptidase domain-containing ABC transporter [Anaerolineae bacterium]|nr:peptidase domain-containing ABC transporter [Anaerolineae bacterium]